MAPSVTLRWSDVWLLAAIYYSSASRPAPLTHILAASDLINHATLTIEEMQSGLFRLARAGLITQAGKALSFQCTPAARERIGHLKAASKTYFDIWKALEASLGVAPWVPGEPVPHPDNVQSYPGLTEALFASALGSYLKPRGTPRRPKKRLSGPNEPPA